MVVEIKFKWDLLEDKGVREISLLEDVTKIF